MSQTAAQFLPLVALIAIMYFLMIRPQRKKDKQINEMRKSLMVGDEIVTIGGIYGKIVKTKDETIVIQTGADRVRLEMARWSVSSVVKDAPRKAAAKAEAEDVKEEDAPKKSIKRLRKETPAEAEDVKEEVKETVQDVQETVEDLTEELDG
ncbi:MAG: preprotein translocase subunit YajC [Anaerovoracaceae bacterium]|nr:preprotein translocase subunit YajC [Bacillota bacterium]MEE3382817.1 preprotein translocase subunit YajC [Anaerovoracaceae bacterium]